MMTQLVPFDTNSAHAPSVAGKIAVPAASPSIGTTLDVLDITVCAWMVLIVNSRPSQLAALGKVIVVDALLLTISHVTPSATV
jgi:hypothetical protein